MGSSGIILQKFIILGLAINILSKTVPYCQKTYMDCNCTNLNLDNQKLLLIRDVHPMGGFGRYCTNFFLFNCSINQFPANFFHSLINSENSYQLEFQRTRLVYLNNTKIYKIDSGAFVGMNELKEIYLNSNFLSYVHKGVFNSLVSLTKIDLSYNNITAIEDESFLGSNNLREILLNNNKLFSLQQSLFITLPNLQFLNLSSNFLSSVRANFVREIDLSSNRIESIDFRGNDTVSLWRINLNNNFITQIDGSLLPAGLKQINISNNKIKIINFSSLKLLEIVDLSQNNISFIDKNSFMNLKRLEFLNLQNNFLSYLHVSTFRDLQSLKWLNLSYNFLIEIELGTFMNLQQLVNLDVSHNEFAAFQKDYLFNLQELRTFNISYNHINNFEITKIKSFCPRWREVGLKGNNYTCTTLLKLFKSAKIEGIQITADNETDSLHINGIACTKSYQQISGDETIFSDNKITDEKLSKINNQIDTLILKTTTNGLIINILLVIICCLIVLILIICYRYLTRLRRNSNATEMLLM